jgi:hypothetical protein
MRIHEISAGGVLNSEVDMLCTGEQDFTLKAKTQATLYCDGKLRNFF